MCFPKYSMVKLGFKLKACDEQPWLCDRDRVDQESPLLRMCLQGPRAGTWDRNWGKTGNSTQYGTVPVTQEKEGKAYPCWLLLTALLPGCRIRTSFLCPSIVMVTFTMDPETWSQEKMPWNLKNDKPKYVFLSLVLINELINFIHITRDLNLRFAVLDNFSLT